MTGKEAYRQKVRALEEADPQEVVMILLLEQKGEDMGPGWPISPTWALARGLRWLSIQELRDPQAEAPRQASGSRAEVRPQGLLSSISTQQRQAHTDILCGQPALWEKLAQYRGLGGNWHLKCLFLCSAPRLLG